MGGDIDLQIDFLQIFLLKKLEFQKTCVEKEPWKLPHQTAFVYQYSDPGVSDIK